MNSPDPSQLRSHEAELASKWDTYTKVGLAPQPDEVGKGEEPRPCPLESSERPIVDLVENELTGR